MHRPYNRVKNWVRTYPIPLGKLENKALIEFANKFLPYETGIEIEIHTNYNRYDTFKSLQPIYEKVKNIIEIGMEDCEIKFRIPSGIKGMICLYEICDYLKENYKLNEKSGIHYHIDCRDMYNTLPYTYQEWNSQGAKWERFIKSKSEILNWFESWGYKGTYNDKDISTFKSSWIRICYSYQTLEIRIGEMTFDYQTIIKRIMHSQNIIRKLKAEYELIHTEESTLSKWVKLS